MSSIHYINLNQNGGANVERSFLVDRKRQPGAKKVVDTKEARLQAAAEIQRLDREIANLVYNNEVVKK